jgi:hypothetical protein
MESPTEPPELSIIDDRVHVAKGEVAQKKRSLNSLPLAKHSAMMETIASKNEEIVII